MEKKILVLKKAGRMRLTAHDDWQASTAQGTAHGRITTLAPG
jgi:hypothetical protein